MRHNIRHRAIAVVGEMFEHQDRYGFGGKFCTARRIRRAQNISAAQASRVIAEAKRLGYLVEALEARGATRITYSLPANPDAIHNIAALWALFKDVSPDIALDILGQFKFKEVL